MLFYKGQRTCDQSCCSLFADSPCASPALLKGHLWRGHTRTSPFSPALCKRCPLDICLLRKERRQCTIFTSLLLSLGLGLHFRNCRSDSGSAFALYNWATIPAGSFSVSSFLKQKYLLLSCKCYKSHRKPCLCTGFRMIPCGREFALELKLWGWVPLFDVTWFSDATIVNSFEIFTKTKLPFDLKRTSSLGHEFTIACSKKSLFLLLSGWSGWLVFRLSQMVIKMDGAPVLASCHFTAFLVLSWACFPSSPPRLQGQKISQEKRFSLAKCLSELSQLLWNN